MRSEQSELVACGLHSNDKGQTLQTSTPPEIHQRKRIRLPSSLCKPSLRAYFDWDDTGNDDYAKRPTILDLFSGSGGAAMGYYLSGFRVIGVDIKPQPHYPFEFHQADALTYPLDGFDAYHASPPCQHASTIAKQNRALRPGKYNHPNLIPETRARLVPTRKPYTIENVKTPVLINPVKLTGSWFGLDVKRDRYFECNFAVWDTPFSNWQKPRFRSLDKRRDKMACVVGVHGHINYHGESEIRARAMGIDWMIDKELTQAIPPAYTEYIGKYLMQAVLAGGAE
jgi:DNA (cytosine-5)-methyltransferase 1